MTVTHTVDGVCDATHACTQGAQADGGDVDADGNVAKGGLMTSEERSTGAVDRRVYFEYMKAMGPRVVLLSLVALFFVSNFTVQIQQW